MSQDKADRTAQAVATRAIEQVQKAEAAALKRIEDAARAVTALQAQLARQQSEGDARIATLEEQVAALVQKLASLGKKSNEADAHKEGARPPRGAKPGRTSRTNVTFPMAERAPSGITLPPEWQQMEKADLEEWIHRKFGKQVELPKGWNYMEKLEIESLL